MERVYCRTKTGRAFLVGLNSFYGTSQSFDISDPLELLKQRLDLLSKRYKLSIRFK